MAYSLLKQTYDPDSYWYGGSSPWIALHGSSYFPENPDNEQ